MYQDAIMRESAEKVAAARAETSMLDPRRMTAEEKDQLLKEFHPDYRAEKFAVLQVGPNKGEKVPTELAALLQAQLPHHCRSDRSHQA